MSICYHVQMKLDKEKHSEKLSETQTLPYSVPQQGKKGMKELPPLHRKIWRAKEKPKIRIKTDFLPNVSIKKKSSERNWWIKNYLLDVITKLLRSWPVRVYMVLALVSQVSSNPLNCPNIEVIRQGGFRGEVHCSLEFSVCAHINWDVDGELVNDDTPGEFEISTNNENCWSSIVIPLPGLTENVVVKCSVETSTGNSISSREVIVNGPATTTEGHSTTSVLSGNDSINETTGDTGTTTKEVEENISSSTMTDGKYGTGSRKKIITVFSILLPAFVLGTTILIATILIISRNRIRRCFRNSNGNVRTQAEDPNTRQTAIQLENLDDQDQEEHEMFSDAVPNTSTKTADLSGHRKEKQFRENKPRRKNQREVQILQNGTEMTEVVKAGYTKELPQVVSLIDDDYEDVLEYGTVKLEFSQPLTLGDAIRSFGVLVQPF